MKRVIVLLTLVSVSAVGAVAHHRAHHRAPSPRPRVPVAVDGAPMRGNSVGIVTIVSYSDFTCSHCSVVDARLRRFVDDARVRLVWKDLPGRRRADAQLAAEAARAAEAQGRFWSMHDALLAHQGRLSRDVVGELARGVGLDMQRFDRALAEGRFRGLVQADAEEGRRLGIKTVPTLFVNGRRVDGEQTDARLAQLVDEEAAAAHALAARDIPADALYDALLKRERPDDTTYKVDLGDSPVRGRADALVTVTLWDDVASSSARAFAPVLRDTLAAFGDDVRLVWKHFPTSSEGNVAHEALAAAAAQRRFWPLYDELAAHPPKRFDASAIAAAARRAGLDLPSFRQALAQRTGRPAVAADVAEGARLGVAHPPALFIDGVPLERIDLAELRRRIAFEQRRATALVRAGVPRDRLFATITRDGLIAPAVDPAEDRVYDVDAKSGFSDGPATAPVTLVELADFECYYCRAMESTLRRVRSVYGDRVRIVWKNYPLEAHEHAELAAEAAMAAGAQGQFWPMHDRLLAATQLDRASIDSIAHEIGLDMDRFRRALDGEEFKPAVAVDAAEGDRLFPDDGPATPTIFVNGRAIVGAVPFELLKQRIDHELTRRQLALR